MLDIIEFYKNDNNQLREQVKDLEREGFTKFTSEQTKSINMTPPNLSVNIDKNIATENFSEKSHEITTIDSSINKSFSTRNC